MGFRGRRDDILITEEQVLKTGEYSDTIHKSVLREGKSM